MRRTSRACAPTFCPGSWRRPRAPADALALPNRISLASQLHWHAPCVRRRDGTKRIRHITFAVAERVECCDRKALHLVMDSNAALDAILALRAIWDQKRGRVTLADLEILVQRRVRTRGAAALPPERWRGRPWRATTRHEVVFEA